MIEHYLQVGMKRSQRDAVVAMLTFQPELMGEFVRLVLVGTRTQRMKGAWVLSGVHAENNSLLRPHYPEILLHLHSEEIGGVKRELLKCFVKARLSSDSLQQLLLIAMKWVTDHNQDLAIRYVCHKILKERLADFPELNTELKERIELYRDKFGRFP